MDRINQISKIRFVSNENKGLILKILSILKILLSVSYIPNLKEGVLETGSLITLSERIATNRNLNLA